MSGTNKTDDAACHHQKEGGGCAALRVLEDRIRKLEDQAHVAFHQKLKSPPRKRTVHKPAVSTHPTVKRKASNPVCPGCQVPLIRDHLATLTSATCTACDTFFYVS